VERGDLVGRLIDPLNPYYSHDEAKLWHKIEPPALAEENESGARRGRGAVARALDAEYLNEIKMSDRAGSCRSTNAGPSLREGAFFRAQDIIGYNSISRTAGVRGLRFTAPAIRGDVGQAR
jgi:hypothetical protein